MLNNQQPVIKDALGEKWDDLADIVKKHYDITPGNPSRLIIKGVMDEVYHSAIAKLFILPGRIFGALVPYKGRDIPTVVCNWTSKENKKAMFWYRTLDFPGKPSFIFASRMEHIKGDMIIEYVRYGMGICMKISVEEGALVFNSTGYIWKIGGIKIPIPTWLILGNARIVERAISDDKFHIEFDIAHPLFGRTFSYSGDFCISESDN